MVAASCPVAHDSRQLIVITSRRQRIALRYPRRMAWDRTLQSKRTPSNHERLRSWPRRGVSWRAFCLLFHRSWPTTWTNTIFQNFASSERDLPCKVQRAASGGRVSLPTCQRMSGRTSYVSKGCAGTEICHRGSSWASCRRGRRFPVPARHPGGTSDGRQAMKRGGGCATVWATMVKPSPGTHGTQHTASGNRKAR
jgi:hypothetical protein